MLDRLRDSELDLHSPEQFDFTVVIGDCETARDDVVEIDHRSCDDV